MIKVGVLPNANIYIDVQGSTVTLTGIVNRFYIKQLSQAVMMRHTSIDNLKNNICVVDRDIKPIRSKRCQDTFRKWLHNTQQNHDTIQDGIEQLKTFWVEVNELGYGPKFE